MKIALEKDRVYKSRGKGLQSYRVVDFDDQIVVVRIQNKVCNQSILTVFPLYQFVMAIDGGSS